MNLSNKRLSRGVVVELTQLNHKTAQNVVNVMMKVMADMLLAGHEIKIDGFGIWRVKMSNPLHNRFCIENGQGLRTYPGRKKVFFKPSKALLRYINA